MTRKTNQENNRILYIHRIFKRLDLKDNNKNKKRRVKNKNWKKVSFPKKIELIHEPDSTLEYFNQAYKYFRTNNNIEFDLSLVSYFSPESIALFAACIADKRYTNNMNSIGNMPKSFLLRKLFYESGFFDHVTVQNTNSQPVKRKANKLLHKITDFEVETDIATEFCLYVKNKINAKYIDDLEPLYVILIEAMQNTNNHASDSHNNKGKYDWWLYRYENKNEKITHFTFLDIGVGVFNSLSVRNWKRKLSESVRITSNLDLVDDLMEGKIKSRTLRKNRGKGVPQICNSSLDEMFDEFFMLSNDILINLKTGSKKKLKEEFHGTMYYWTIKWK